MTRPIITIFVWYCSLCMVFAQGNFNAQERTLDSLMRSVIDHYNKPPVHNFMLYARNFESGFEAHKGVGIVGRNDEPIDANFQFKNASITKMFTAALTLQLVEQGLLSLDDPVAKYLGDVEYVRFSEFHTFEGINYSDSITVEHLLRHSSGLADLFEDTNFILTVLVFRNRRFDPDRVIRKYFKYKLHKKTTNRPGDGYHYSDMNYTLLALVIEQITGTSYPQALRKRILEPLQLENTFLEYHEPMTGHGRQVDTYIDKINITRKVNTSFEYGAGGLVSTTEEQARFIKALFDLEVFKNQATLDLMTDISHSKQYGQTAGMGMFKFDFADREFYGHGGFYGSLLLYCPSEDVVLCATVGQANQPFDTRRLIDDMARCVVETN